MSETELVFYRRQSAWTEPGRFAPVFDRAPDDLAEQCRFVQNLVLHKWLAGVRRVALPAAALDDNRARTVTAILERLEARTEADLSAPRAPDARFSGVCRDYALLLIALLRHKGQAARLRVGFAGYFDPDFHDDHWVAECWDAAAGRWHLVDAQLDTELIADEGIEFDPLDVPRDAFEVGALAWRRVRAGEADVATYGVSFIDNGTGLWMVASRLMGDLAALNAIEMQPWDYWGIGERIGAEAAIPAGWEARFDDLAAALKDEPPDFAGLRATYREEPEFQVGDTVVSYLATGDERVAA